MLVKRIIPCLDVKENVVVKGKQFKNHGVLGDIMHFALNYIQQGADELVFYDITASCEKRTLNYSWISQLAEHLTIPFCVAGGITNAAITRKVLAAGADKISINSPALANPYLISELADIYGSQCVVVGIDSYAINNDYYVYQYTGNPEMSRSTNRRTLDWAEQVEKLGAGEIVVNCMNQDGMRQGYDLAQLKLIKSHVNIPIIASGGAGQAQHFRDVFAITQVDGALAASVFHSGKITIPELKQYLNTQDIRVRL